MIAQAQLLVLGVLGIFGDAIDFIFQSRESQAGTVRIGGLGEIGDFTLIHMELSLAATLAAMAIAIPIGLWLGHIGRFEFLATSVSNVGRAVPAVGLIVFFITLLGVGFVNVGFALMLLAIPPILTNTYVGIQGVERALVDAARGQGLTETQIVRRVELPLALPTMMGGIRIAFVSVIATATIAPLSNVNTLGTPVISPNIYGGAGQLGSVIVLAVVTLAADAALVAIQRAVTPTGLKVGQRTPWWQRRPAAPIPQRSVQST